MRKTKYSSTSIILRPSHLGDNLHYPLNYTAVSSQHDKTPVSTVLRSQLMKPLQAERRISDTCPLHHDVVAARSVGQGRLEGQLDVVSFVAFSTLDGRRASPPWVGGNSIILTAR